MNDLIQVIDCLTKEQCHFVINSLNQDHWSPSTVFIGDGKTGVETGIRNNDRICLPDQVAAAEVMHEGMNEALLKYRDALYHVSPQFNNYPVPGSSGTSCFRETIQVLRYNPGEYYEWHKDQASDDVHEKNRTISIVLYLKNAEEGGRTIFPHRAFRPKEGQALIFPSNWCFPHRAEEVFKGQKIAAVTWYHSKLS